MTAQEITAKYAKCCVCRKDGIRAEMLRTANMGHGQLPVHAECLK